MVLDTNLSFAAGRRTKLVSVYSSRVLHCPYTYIQVDGTNLQYGIIQSSNPGRNSRQNRKSSHAHVSSEKSYCTKILLAETTMFALRSVKCRLPVVSFINMNRSVLMFLLILEQRSKEGMRFFFDLLFAFFASVHNCTI